MQSASAKKLLKTLESELQTIESNESILVGVLTSKIQNINSLIDSVLNTANINSPHVLHPGIKHRLNILNLNSSDNITINGSFLSLDESIAVVDKDGHVSLVDGTNGESVTIVFSGTCYDNIAKTTTPVQTAIVYMVYKPNVPILQLEDEIN